MANGSVWIKCFVFSVKTKCDGRGNRTALQTFEDCKQVDVHNWVQELIIVMIATTTQLFSSEFYVLLVFLMCICLCAFVKRKSRKLITKQIIICLFALVWTALQNVNQSLQPIVTSQNQYMGSTCKLLVISSHLNVLLCYSTRHIFQWSGFIATTCTSLGADRSHIESDQSNQEQSKHKVNICMHDTNTFIKQSLFVHHVHAIPYGHIFNTFKYFS